MKEEAATVQASSLVLAVQIVGGRNGHSGAG
jgi:hypothetical protein